MKKILSILLAVSMIATAAFAADVTYTAKADNSIAVTGLNLGNSIAGDTVFGCTGLLLSIESPTVGATYALGYGGLVSLWFKPIDALQVTLLGASVSVGYDLLSGQAVYAEDDHDDNPQTSYGQLGLAFTVDPVALEVVLPAGKIGSDLAVKASFNTDVGAAAVLYQGYSGFQSHAIYAELKSSTLVDGLDLNLAGGVDLPSGGNAAIYLHPYAAFAIDAASCGAQADISIANNTTKVVLAANASYDLDETNTISATAAFGVSNDTTKQISAKFTQKLGAGIASSWYAGVSINLDGGTSISLPFGAKVMW